MVGPQPYVKWSHEPPRAQDVPGALARAIHHASLPPRGPAFVSIPMDDWTQEADQDRAGNALRRTVSGRTAADPEALTALAARLSGARNPVLIAGPDIDTAGGWEHAVALAEKQRLPVWASPATGGSRLGFPERHPNFIGVLPPAIGPISETLKDHDLILVVGSSVFPYYPYIPGPLLAEGSAGGDHQRSRRGGAGADGRRDRRRRRTGPGAARRPGSHRVRARGAGRAPGAGGADGRRGARPPERLGGDGGARRRLA